MSSKKQKKRSSRNLMANRKLSKYHRAIMKGVSTMVSQRKEQKKSQKVGGRGQ